MRDKPLQRGHRPQLPSITFQFIIALLGGKSRTRMHAGLFQRKKMLFHPRSSGEATGVNVACSTLHFLSLESKQWDND